jgi:two-component system chemotaxis response regulator CheB
MPEDSAMVGVVVVGASAGGVEALMRLASTLPADLPYAVLVVLHMPSEAPSVLARIVDRAGPLPAVPAEHGTHVLAGHVYVSTPDHHLLLDDHHVAVTKGPTENGHRPAINALFRSAALAFGPRAVGVLLSGVLDDGVLGLQAIKARGGTTICQSPDDALFSSLPKNALAAGVVDHAVPVPEISGILKQVSGRKVEEPSMPRDAAMELENRIAMAPQFGAPIDTEQLGPPSGYTCPDCNGSLQSIEGRGFRCQVGHAWTADALLEARDSEIEGALWVAVRSLQEKAKLSRTLAEKVGPGMMAVRYTAAADEADRALAVLRDRLSSIGLSGRE